MTPAAQDIAWFAADWGTSNLRVWAMARDGRVLARFRSDQGMGGLAPDQFEPVLLDLLEGRVTPDTPVIICGMAGSRQGWAEAPYADAPCPVPGIREAVSAPTRDPGLTVRILPGIRQVAQPDVMRGEETQIAGFLAQEPQFDGVLCLPGTHTKWVRISANEVVSFQTFMTGELFALLAKSSVLRHSVGDEGWDDAAFRAALDDAIARPAGVAAQLFALRAAGLVGPQKAEAARARLSGLLIGMELAAARPYWLGQEIAIIGADALCRLYATALDAQAVRAQVIDGDALTLAGLKAAHDEWETLST